MTEDGKNTNRSARRLIRRELTEKATETIVEKMTGHSTNIDEKKSITFMYFQFVHTSEYIVNTMLHIVASIVPVISATARSV